MIVRPTARVIALDPAGGVLLFRCEIERRIVDGEMLNHDLT